MSTVTLVTLMRLEDNIFSYDNFDIGKRYLFLDKTGRLCHESKGDTSWLGRLLHVLFGSRDYRLDRILAKVLSNLNGVDTYWASRPARRALAERTFRVMRFDAEQSRKLASLLIDKSVVLDSRSQGLLDFNRKISRSLNRLGAIFAAERREHLVHDLRTFTFKTAIFGVNATSRINKLCNMDLDLDLREIVMLEKLWVFRNSFLDHRCGSFALVEDDPVHLLAQLASHLRDALLAKIQHDPADIIFYDAATTQSAGLWSYSWLQNLYFAIKGSGLGHVAVEYRRKGWARVSHMMCDYTDSPIYLEACLSRRYRLNLWSFMSEEAKGRLLQEKGEQSEPYLRQMFDALSDEHILAHHNELSKALNPPSNQVLFITDITAFKESLDVNAARPYRETMLCSEYAQISLVNRLLALGAKLKEELSLKSGAIRLPIGPRDFDRVGPADFFKRWQKHLTPVSNISSILRGTENGASFDQNSCG